MVKVTPHDNLVPCVRDAYVFDHPYNDLIHNVLHAKELIRAAAHFFHIRKNCAVYSGYIHKHSEMFFTINLWHEGVKVRSLVLADLGYGGALHCEITGPFEEVIGWDLLGSLALDKKTTLVAAVQ